MPAIMDSIGKPGISPPGLMLSGLVNTCPLVLIVIVCVEETPFLLDETA
jgi:hypothetical protein